MSSPQGPTEFRDLPRELRILIWEAMEPPMRIIGQIPCTNCGLFPPSRLPKDIFRVSDRAECRATKHPSWDFRYVVHPRSCAVFPPLHTCRESRSIWQKKLRKTPRYLRSTDWTCRVRFDVPYICYERDIFSVLEVLVEYQRKKVWKPKADVVPEQAFVGLDLSRVRYVGIRENVNLAWTLLSFIPFRSLPALRSLTLITFGPVPKSLETGSPPRWLEMTPPQAQQFECRLRNLKGHPTSELWIVNQRLFNSWRPTAQTALRRENSTVALDESITLVEAMVWHIYGCLKRRRMTPAQRERGAMLTPLLLEFLRRTESESEYEDGRGPRDTATCPFRLPGCGQGGHTRNEMLEWDPRLRVTSKYLCEKEWLAKFDYYNVFREPRTKEELEKFLDFVEDNYRVA